MPRGRLPAFRCRHPHHVAGPERPSGRNAYPSGNTPSTITSPTGRPAGSRTEISPGARAHHDHVPNQPHAPPPPPAAPAIKTISRLTRGPDTDKRKRRAVRANAVRLAEAPMLCLRKPGEEGHGGAIAVRGMKIGLGGSVRPRAYGRVIRDGGFLGERR